MESSVLNATYGVTRNAATDLTTDYWDKWILRTSKFTYRTANTPSDLSLFFNNNTAATRTLTRDLGTPSDATTQWTLNTSVNFDNNTPNHGSNGGQYLDVLDDTGLIIARFYSRQLSFPNDYRITANTLNIAQINQTTLAAVMELWQPLTITATSTGITFNYAAYPPVAATVFDAGANWRRPKNLRITFFCTGPSGGYGRSVALRTATFTRTPVTAAPDFALGTATLTGGNANGVLDRNEHNLLTIPLGNTGLGDATGITATLTTTTPGITILQPQSPYLDLPPGLFGNNTIAFELDSAPEIPAGTAAELTLLITHAGGSTSRTFTLAPTTGALGNGRIDTDADGIADWWTLQNFGHRTALASDLSRALDVPFSDGTPNLLKFALGLDAQANGLENRLSSGITTTAGQDYLHLTYTRPEPAPNGLDYTVETSPTLATWTSSGAVEVSSNVNGSLRTITIRGNTPIAPGTREFLHLKVSKP